MTQAASGADDARPIAVAFADDDPVWRGFAGEALRAAGFVVHEHADGDSLLEALVREPVDAVLVDAVMPGTDGFAVCRAVRSNPSLVRLPVMMLTSLDGDEAVRAAYDAGASDFFIKTRHGVLLAERTRHLVRVARRNGVSDSDPDSAVRTHPASRILDYDVTTGVLHGAPGSFGVFGLGSDRCELSQQELWRYIDPHDRLPFFQAVADSVRRMQPFRAEFRLHTPAGELRHLIVEGGPRLDATGAVRLLRAEVRDQTDEQRRNQEIERLATRDPLTGLPNRAEFLRRLADELRRCEGDATQVHLILFNLDRFAHFNETLGQGAGDELIAEAGRRVASVVARGLHWTSNITPSSDARLCVARFPGDEFALMVAGVRERDATEALVRGVLTELRHPCRIEDIDCFLSASAGLAAFPVHADRAEFLLSRADRASRLAKARGRNDFAWCVPVRDGGGRARIQMQSDLHRAVERGEFEVHYQPWIDLGNARVTGLEALVRWRREGVLVSPAEFIPIAEDTGLIVPIGECVMRQAARDLAVWRAAGLRLDCVAVNVPTQHFERDSLLDTMCDVIERHRLAPGAIELELTETCMVQDFERTLPRLQSLIRAGVRLAIDDFGTGYSSLAYLTRLPISKLKVDRAFVSQLGISREGEAVCRAIVALGRSLGVHVLAEGVETVEQLRALRELGCATMQGYLFSRPVPADQVPAAIAAAEARARREAVSKPLVEFAAPHGAVELG
jgi:diguanylate cyclase (GGDEF)-like protein